MATANFTAATAAPASSASLPILIGLPIIVVLFTIVLVLLVVLAWLSLRSRYQTARSYGYASIPPDEPMHFSKLPYKPAAIKLGDPPLPSMSFHMATQLDGSATFSAGSHYPNPFAPHRSQSKLSIYASEKRPPRLRTRRKGNHKHGRGKHTILQNAEPSPEVVEEEKQKKKGGGDGRLSIVSLSTPTDSPSSMLAQARRSSSVESTRDKHPEIFVTLLYNKDTASFVVRIERVSGLPSREDGAEVDAYVRLYIIPKVAQLPQRKTAKTKTARRESSPVFDEEISYDALSEEELINSTLHLQVLDYQSYGKHRLLGQVDVHLVQVSFIDGEAFVNLALQPPTVRENLGTVLLSLCYSPDSQKLSVIILRAKDLNKGVAKDIDAQAKLCVTHGDKVLGKLKTKRKPQSSSPIFNEALTCTVEPGIIRSILVYATMMNESSRAVQKEVGQVILGSQSMGEEYRHWSDILATPGKHIAEWHELKAM